MGEMLLNGRKPLDWELPAIRRGYAHLLERDTEQLAGVLTEARRPEPKHEGRPVTDLFLELS